MKVKRIFAPDMQNAMRRVREEIGPDAVILSNKRVAGGVEVVASPESEYETAQAKLTQERELRKAEQIALLTGLSGESRKALDEELARARARIGEALMNAEEPALRSTANRQVRDSNSELERLLREDSSHRASQRAQKSQSIESVDRVQAADGGQAIAGLQAEIDQLKQMLQQQMLGQQLAPTRETPPPMKSAAPRPSGAASKVQRQVFGRLVKLGLSEPMAQGLVTGLEPNLPVDRAWRNALSRLAESLPVFGEELVDRGGMIALVGPTGAGKTTTIGKLATRYVLEHGSAGIALVTTDSYRIGAHEQIKTFGRILDIPVRVVDENNSLDQVLQSLRSKRLVLIDTAGMNTRDPAGQEQLEMLQNCNIRMKKLLVLSTSSQRVLMEQAYSNLAPIGLNGMILTKVDEAGSLGEALALSIDKQLRVAYVSEGQRVPDDIEIAQRKDLISRAVVLMQQGLRLSRDVESTAPVLSAVRQLG